VFALYVGPAVEEEEGILIGGVLSLREVVVVAKYSVVNGTK
jgi:hypothetical protein